MPFELGLEQPDGTDEGHAQVEMPRGRERAVNNRTRSEVAPEGVNGNPHHRDGASGLLLFNALHLSAPVVPAIRTDTVRRLRLVTVRALAEPHRLQCVMRAALGRARL